MISRRLLFAALGFLAVCGPGRLAAALEPAVATISRFYDVLLTVMKDGQKLGFAGRRDKLAPAIKKAFDLPLMTRLTVGLQWLKFSPADQGKLVDAFSAFSIATYASRFDDYANERFEVDPTPTAAANGDVIVHSKLVQHDGQPVALDYLMRQDGGIWQIIDVYLSGTISELATRRSEFSDVLRRGGAAALVDLLQQKTAALSG
jgi:phospholipid transport system substrate-binding protein